MINKDRLQMYVSLTKITIVLCWLSLFSFWAIKLFGGNWFEIMVKNDNFIKLSIIIQNTWVKYPISFVTIFLSTYLALCAISQKFYFKGWQLIVAISIIILSWVFSSFVNIEFLKMWFGYIAIIVFGLIFQNGYKKLFGILPLILETLFACISMMTRNIKVEITSNYFLAIILSIDLYIMSFLYYLYSNLIRMKKEI